MLVIKCLHSKIHAILKTMMEENNNKVIHISVVIPVFNEQEVIKELHERLAQTLSPFTEHYELIFVNDGSKDNSMLELLTLSKQDSRVFYINLSRNFGHQIAVSAGLDACRGEVVVIIDGDLQDPPELIAELYKKYQEGNEVVYARRKERKGESVFKKTNR